MSESLEDRIRDHTSAFNGLLSLIPSKLYYGAEATTANDSADGSHLKKKKTKAEKKAAKKARLDPDNDANRSAKDVMDEAGRKKRKLQELEEAQNADADEYEQIDGIEPEKPREGLKEIKERTKKAKIAASTAAEDGKEAETATEKTEKTEMPQADEAKTQKKTEKQERKKQKLEQKKTAKAAGPKQQAKKQTEETEAPAKAEAKADAGTTGGEEKPEEETPETQETENTQESQSTQDTDNEATLNTAEPEATKPKLIKVPKDTAAFRERFAAKMAELRAARKADGTDGKPVRTRQELIESRRAKQLARKAHKKELWQAAKREEELKREQALASNSPSVLSPGMELDEAAATANFSFGRVAFEDGTQLSHDLSYSLSRENKKGPSDAKTALLKLQNNKKRLAAMAPEKRAEIEDKEAWLTARRRAEGEKIRDDEASLKKAVKRKERVKKRSEREWQDRIKGVEKAKMDKQKKREENIRKRKDGKLERKLEKAMGKKRKSGAGKKKARPGFEGSGFGKKK
ncbi:hypothetical protein TD95_004750 [Thielaviopsis punctulata]|uniref:Ribosomal RNA-processing protein 14/surfeit locus protein 6 C-terminal domain-containing protein n=1 Tax=Thielaviopsis punctulata TaxID=72032 RepID=A0A0F4ZEI5_9PEZI|nr:hypothetical protein TD95_004750 [Thielaviopsis punctulata]